MSEKFEKPLQPAAKLTPEDIKKLMDKYGELGLQEHENGEYFFIPEKDGGRTMLHKFHKIGDMPIEERIKELLSDRIKEK